MSPYYIKGGSKFNEANPNVWVALHLAGYPSGHYLDSDWKDFNTSGALEDPYWRLGGDGGLKEVEFGLSGHQRIKINTAGIWGWHVDSGAWFSLYESGAGAVGDHGELEGLDDDDHSQYLNIARGDARYYKTGLLFKADELYHTGQLFTSTYIIAQYTSGNIFDELSGDYSTHQDNSTAHHTPPVAGDFSHNSLANLNAGDVYEHISQAQKTALHAESHDLASHSTKAHAELTDYNAEANVKHLTDAEMAALHAIYTLEEHNNTKHNPNYATETDFQSVSGDFSTTSGIIADYPSLSGDYVDTKLDYLTTSGVISDYPTVSGDFAEVSGDWAAGGFLTEIVQDLTPQLGGNLDCLARTITSNDANTYHLFGRAYVGYCNYDDLAAFGHRDMRTTTAYALLQSFDGTTFVNSPTGKTLWFRNGNSDKMSIDANGVHLNSHLDLNGKCILIENALSADGKFEGDVLTITNAQAFGKAVYISANNTVGLADKDSLTTMPPIGISVGTNLVLIQGTVREDDWNWTANDKIFVGDAGALITDISGFGTGDIIHCIGIAIDPNTILVKTFDWVEKL